MHRRVLLGSGGMLPTLRQPDNTCMCMYKPHMPYLAFIATNQYQGPHIQSYSGYTLIATSILAMVF